MRWGDASRRRRLHRASQFSRAPVCYPRQGPWLYGSDPPGSGVMAEHEKPVVFTTHALTRMRERGAAEEDVREAIRIGHRESAQRGLFSYRLNVEFRREWDGRYYGMQ